MKTSTQEVSEVEAAVVGTPLLRSYVVRFRDLNEIKEKHFHHPENLNAAIKRGRDHCLVMGYHFIQVRPFFVDLDKQESDYLTNKD